MICRALLFYAVFSSFDCDWVWLCLEADWPIQTLSFHGDRSLFGFILFLFFFFGFSFFFFFPFFIFPLKKSLMRFPIGQIWSDPRSLIFHFFLFISAQKQHGDISFSTRHTHKHILRAHTNRRDEDWHFSWSRPFNSNGTTLTQSYRKKWLSNQMASSTDLTRQHRR